MAKHYTGAAGLLATLLMAGAAQADTVFGVYAGAGVWKQEYSGAVASGAEDIDIERDLDLENQQNNVLYLAVEHPIPVLPNLRVAYSDVSTDGASTLTRSVTFQGQTFTVSDDITSQLELTQTDAVAYYELLDNVVSLDLGLVARYIEGNVEIESSSGFAQAEFEGVLPLLYGRARVDLPFTGVWVGGELAGIGYDGHKMTDLNVQVGYESSIGLGAEVGWRSLNLTLDSFEDIDDAEIDVSGPYAAVNFHF